MTRNVNKDKIEFKLDKSINKFKKKTIKYPMENLFLSTNYYSLFYCTIFHQREMAIAFSDQL